MQLDEIKSREKGLFLINNIITQKGVESIIDLTGLAGGFNITPEDITYLETYAGPAIFDEKIQELGKEHMGGEKVLPLNRTSSGIVATILTIVKPGTKIIHYLPKKPGHPSIQTAAQIVGADYEEYTDINDMNFDDNVSLVVITGTTMDYEVIDVEEFKKVITKSKEYDITVFVDDASGARLRRVAYNQPTAIDLGADLSVTSTDKLMEGPRGGLMVGSEESINKIKLTVNKLGLEAQPPLVAGMVRGLEKYTPERIQNAFKQKDELNKKLKDNGLNPLPTPTGFMFKKEEIFNEVTKRGVKTDISDYIIATLYSMLLLKNYNIITIPAVGMPKASRTIRIDWSSKHSEKLTMDELVDAINNTFDKVVETIENNAVEEELYNII